MLEELLEQLEPPPKWLQEAIDETNAAIRAVFLRDLARRQQPLGEEIEKIWEDHATELYGI